MDLITITCAECGRQFEGEEGERERCQACFEAQLAREIAPYPTIKLDGNAQTDFVVIPVCGLRSIIVTEDDLTWEEYDTEDFDRLTTQGCELAQATVKAAQTDGSDVQLYGILQAAFDDVDNDNDKPRRVLAEAFIHEVLDLLLTR